MFTETVYTVLSIYQFCSPWSFKSTRKYKSTFLVRDNIDVANYWQETVLHYTVYIIWGWTEETISMSTNFNCIKTNLLKMQNIEESCFCQRKTILRNNEVYCVFPETSIFQLFICGGSHCNLLQEIIFLVPFFLFVKKPNWKASLDYKIWTF